MWHAKSKRQKYGTRQKRRCVSEIPGTAPRREHYDCGWYSDQKSGARVSNLPHQLLIGTKHSKCRSRKREHVAAAHSSRQSSKIKGIRGEREQQCDDAG